MGTYSFFMAFTLFMNLASCYMQELYERDNWVHELVLDDEVDKTDALLTVCVPIRKFHAKIIDEGSPRKGK
jgi:hypothetical protein